MRKSMFLSAEGIGIIIFCVIMVAVGALFAKRAQKSSEDFFLSGRNNSTPLVTAGHVMGWVGAGTLVGVYGTGYTAGVAAAIWYPIGFSVSFFFFGFVFSKRLKRLGDTRGVTTFIEILRRRFSPVIGVAHLLLELVQAIAFFAGQIIATALILNMSMGVPYLAGLIIATVIVLVYVSMGGLSGSLTNTLIQMGITIVGLIIAVAIGVNNSDGFGGLMASLPADFNPNPFAGQTFGGVLAGFLPTFLACFCYSSMFLRTFSARSEKTSFRSCMWAGVIAFGIVGLTIIGICVCVVVVPGLETGDYALFEMFRRLLPIGGAIFAAAVLAACMSTASESLICESAVFSKDIYQALLKPHATDKEVIWVSRAFMLFMCVVGVLISWKATSILNMMYFAASIVAAITPVFAAGFWWKRINTPGALAGIIGGFATSILWYVVPVLSTFIAPLYAGLIVCVIAMVVVTFLTPPPSEEQLRFIRPMQVSAKKLAEMDAADNPEMPSAS